MRGTSAIIISDSLEQRDVVRLHPKEKYENNTRTIICDIFCAKGGLLLTLECMNFFFEKTVKE